LTALSARGQTIVDNVPGGRGTGPRDVAETELRSARLIAGPFRFLPLVELWNVGWNSNVSGSEEHPRGDVTANALGGIRGLVGLNHRLYFRGSGAAVYSWFRRETARRQLGFSYDGSVILSVPRFNLDAGVEHRESTTNISSELDRPVFERTLTAHTEAEFRLLERLSVFGSAALLEPRYTTAGFSPDEAAGIRALERNDKVWGGGLRYFLGSGVAIGASVEETRTRFVSVPQRDADGTGYVLGISWTTARVYVNVAGGWREFRPLVPTTAYHKESGGFGSGRVQYEITKRATLNVYGARRRNESAFIGSAFFIETFGGVGLTYGLGAQGLFTIGGFAETGRNDYDSFETSPRVFMKRRDDVYRAGGSVGIPITSRFRLSINGVYSRYDSNLSGYDRNVYTLSSTISYRPPEVLP
jgi:hypothetical protein